MNSLLNFANSLLAADGNVRFPIDPTVRQNVLMAFGILMAIAAVAIIVVIMMQKGTNDNVGVISGATDTFYGKNKQKGKENLLKKITLVLFVFILICAVICFVVGSVGWND